MPYEFLTFFPLCIIPSWSIIILRIQPLFAVFSQRESYSSLLWRYIRTPNVFGHHYDSGRSKENVQRTISGEIFAASGRGWTRNQLFIRITKVRHLALPEFTRRIQSINANNSKVLFRSQSRRHRDWSTYHRKVKMISTKSRKLRKQIERAQYIALNLTSSSVEHCTWR